MADNAAADTLTPAQHKAVSALLSQGSVRMAATTAGVKERTLYSWLKQPAFSDAYRIARREATQQAIARLQQVSGAAVSILCQLMADKETPAAVRLGAASKVLDMAIKAVELEDIMARLAALEAAYAAKA